MALDRRRRRLGASPFRPGGRRVARHRRRRRRSARALNLAGWSALEARRLRRRRDARSTKPSHGAREVGDEAMLSATLHSRGELARRTGDRDGRARTASTRAWRSPARRAGATCCGGRRGAWPHSPARKAASTTPRSCWTKPRRCHPRSAAPRDLADCREEAALIAEARGDFEAAERLAAEAVQILSGSPPQPRTTNNDLLE